MLQSCNTFSRITTKFRSLWQKSPQAAINFPLFVVCNTNKPLHLPLRKFMADGVWWFFLDACLPQGCIWYPVIIMGIAGAAHQSWSANIFSNVGDRFPKHAIATVTGIGGMTGGIGGFIINKRSETLFELADKQPCLLTDIPIRRWYIYRAFYMGSNISYRLNGKEGVSARL